MCVYYYQITFIDNINKYQTIVSLKHKLDTFTTFKVFKILVKNQLNARIKILYDNKGKEYISKEQEELCTIVRIKRIHTLKAKPH